MRKQKPAPVKGPSAEAMVKQGAKAERQLLSRELKAERALSVARARLDVARTRLERRLSAVSDAEALLRTRQAARSAGPHNSDGTSLESFPQAMVGTDGARVEASGSVDAGSSPILPTPAKPSARRRSPRSAPAKGRAS